MRAKLSLLTCLATTILTLWASTQSAMAFVTVTVQPTNQVVLVGGTAVFNSQVSTTGGEVVTGYAWLMSTNGLGPFTTIPGATSAICTLTNLQTTNDGYYFAQVTYRSGTNSGLVSVSAAVRLVMQDQARIVTQPVGGLIRITGTNVSFSVGALGEAPLSYQWRLNRANLANNGRILGANSSTVTIAALLTNDSGSYDVVVTNAYAAVTSQVAPLTVYAPVGIGVPPTNTAVIVGSNAVLSVTASGSAPFTYQWQEFGTNLVNGGRILGVTSNVLTILATVTNDAGNYSVVITNPVSALTSEVATLTVLVPATFTSATNLTWRQGLYLSFTNTATGTLPITFGADTLPEGLSLEPTDGVIWGVPAVTGIFNIALYATNAAMTTTGQLEMTLTTGAPGITSSLAVGGKQGQSFGYTIAASNNPTAFSCGPLPAGLSFSPEIGLIYGPPIVSGDFPITLGAYNIYGMDTQLLMLSITSAAPVITSSRTATWTENRSGFSYTIRASNSPTEYGASGLPAGLVVNTTSGVISGTPWQGGSFTIPIWAANAWGTGTTNLTLTVNYTNLPGLAIADVVTNWSKPFLLDFSFSLRDGPDAAVNFPVVRPPSQFQVTCMEDGVPISSEAPMILASALGSKQLKTALVLDYTYSMFVVPGAIDAMQQAAELLISEEPPHALFSVYEFHADYVDPKLVTTNGFISDKPTLNALIESIEDTYVQGNYAGTRCWDAMYAALQAFGANNNDEQRYLVAMTDGNDSSSLLNTTSDPMDAVVTLYKLAQKNHVRIYCVGYGDNVNTQALQALTSQTGGQYYLASSTTDLASQFQRIYKDLGGQYILRWATLKRQDIPAYPSDGFQPSFQITYGNLTATWNTNIVTTNLDIIDDTVDPPVTNTVETNVVQFPFNPPDWTNDVRLGSLRLVSDADLGPQAVRLRATYVPRSVRTMRLNYRPNYPCTATLDSTNTSEILSGWSMSETADTNGLRTLTLVSSNPTNLLTSIPYAAFGGLVTFTFQYPEAVTSTQAFSAFSVDNTIYSNIQPAGIRFTNENFAKFITVYPQSPPHGTPIPWLIYYGFKTNFAAAELIATNGLPVWQAYLAGLNPTNVNSHFSVWTMFAPGQTPQIMFNTVPTRTYQLETATSLDTWYVLRDNMPGTGGYILFIDNRNLGGVKSVFYRVGVH